MTKRKQLEFLRLGIPFVAFAVLGSFGLSHIIQGRLDVKDAKQEVNDFRAPVLAQRKRERRKRDEKKNEAQLRETVKEEYEFERSAQADGELVVNLSLSLSLSERELSR